jgi:hypothetical protein
MIILSTMTGLSCGAEAGLLTVAAVIFFFYCVFNPEKKR